MGVPILIKHLYIEMVCWTVHLHVDGLVQERHNSIANALELVFFALSHTCCMMISPHYFPLAVSHSTAWLVLFAGNTALWLLQMRGDAQGSYCPVCQRQYRHLKQHIQDCHSGKGEFVCPVCKCIFKQRRSRYRHVKEKHPEMLSDLRYALLHSD